MSDTHDTNVPDQHGEDHGHDDEALGPIDWTMWGVGVVGVVAALIIVAGFALATDFSFIA